MVTFRKVKDEDFNDIAIMYGKYIEWQSFTGLEKETNPKLTAQQMIDVFHKRKKGSQAANYTNSEKQQMSSEHYGWVAERNGEIIAYYEWGGKVSEGSCGCYISVWKKGELLVADQLLAYCFSELKKIGFTLALGHMSRRMRSNSDCEFFKKYIHNIVIEDDGESQLFQRNL